MHSARARCTFARPIPKAQPREEAADDEEPADRRNAHQLGQKTADIPSVGFHEFPKNQQPSWLPQVSPLRDLDAPPHPQRVSRK